jgi:hypothetical protein
MRRLFGRRSNLSEEDRRRLDEAERLVDEFEATLDVASNVAGELRAEGQEDEALSRLVAHRVNWRAQIRKNLKEARTAFERGEADQAQEYLRRATTKANQGTEDIVQHVGEVIDEDLRPPEGSSTAVSYVSITDPRLKVIRDIPVGSCFNENIGSDGRGHGFIEVPCSERHELEMFGRGEVEPGISKYPDAKTMAAQEDRVCRPLFEAYVGVDYNHSEYTFWAYHPERDRWPQDRTIHCALGNAKRSAHDGGSANGSAE